MSDVVFFNPVRAWDKNGQPVSGALARFFQSGTTTPITVYSDVGETIPHPVPLEANSRGIFPPVYRGGAALRVVVTDPEGVTLPGYPVDPAITVSALGSGASEIGFTPTGDIPVTNVQDAIERVQANLVAPLLAGGIGVTGENTLLANLNATNTPSGFYRFDETTTGDRPSGWAGTDTGVVSFLRENATSGLMAAIRRGNAGLWHRRLNAGTWAAWVRVIDSGQAQAQATWNTGTSTNEGPVSPAKIDAKIADKLNAGGGAPLFACRAWVNFDGTTAPPTIRSSGNVSGVIRNGAGDYTINFSASLGSSDYGFLFSTGDVNRIVSRLDQTPNSMRIRTTVATTVANADVTRVMVAVIA